eukprot:CAMPEP_0181244774 /NCGR_PEP_ID=MMETSP1096-20121128/43051_1 /TAXON_ID=156174 ORGANISM="Chrysochromulina ericina, Strain CCMP281" /NCGR_SAMPLE_ID=MMETSP1096 /ASSEMBLY_ACC=CAM_ASM_000453 /LENGTH=68 /DNA_ID=CAMNT_0023341369 /DNA_START=403 /DNA_END=606 /DNA_ORIENTATION=-
MAVSMRAQLILLWRQAHEHTYSTAQRLDKVHQYGAQCSCMPARSTPNLLVAASERGLRASITRWAHER